MKPPPNAAQVGDKNAYARKKSKATPKENANRKKRQRRKVTEREVSAGGEKEHAVESGVDKFEVMEFEGNEKKPATKPADMLQGNGDIDLEATQTEPTVQPKMPKDRKPGRKGRKPQNSKVKVEPLNSEGPPKIVPSDNDAPPNEAQMGDKNAHPGKKSKALPKENANRKKTQRSNHSTEERDPIKIDNRRSSYKGKERRGKKQSVKGKKAGTC